MKTQKGKTTIYNEMKEARRDFDRACLSIRRILKHVSDGSLSLSDNVKSYLSTWRKIRDNAETKLLSF